jgi:hypothetical protein
MIIASIAFGAPGEEVEQMLGTRRFGITLIALTLAAALLHLVTFFGANTPLAGPGNLGIFVLVGFVYLFPHSEVRLIFFSVRSWVLLTFIAATVLFVSIFGAARGESPLTFFSNGGFGLLIGALYFHIKYQKYPLLLRPIQSVGRIFSPTRESTWQGTQAQRRAASPQPARLRMPFQKAPARELSDEERLNIILDRIGERGYDALSEDEKRFLQDYSSRESGR